MKLYIIGKNSEDKGNQLEQLTQLILEQYNIKNICRGMISTGGDEIDVFGVSYNGLGNMVEVPIICECKAHDRLVTLPDWLKFIGKFYTKFLDNQNVNGYFISLSGVNGNVLGAYEEFKKKNKSIKLFQGDELLELISKHFNISPQNDIIAKVSECTDRKIRDTSLIYYDKLVYWAVSFIEGGFTLLDSYNNWIEKEKYENLQSMFNDYTNLTDYIDIETEYKQHIRKQYIEGHILFNCIKHSKISIDELLKSFEHYSPTINVLATEVIKCAINIDFIEYKNDIFRLTNITNKADFFRYILNRPIIPELLECSMYKNLINDELISEIETIQEGMPIPNDKRQDCIRLLQLSPTALIYAVTPDSVIHQGRKLENFITDEIDKKHFDIFMGNIIDGVTIDFENASLHKIHLQKFGLKSLSINRTLVINEDEKDQIIIKHASILKLAVLSEFQNEPAVIINTFETSKIE